MSPRPLSELVSHDWAEALRPVAETITEVGRFLRAELAAGRSYLPAGDQVLRAFTRPLSQAKVLIVGQDPYPTPGHPVGLSFSVAADVRPIPRSLQNIYAELQADLGIRPASSGDLTPWFEQGVLLLNRVLTVQPGRSGSHRGKGWEQVTQRAIEALVARGGPLVAILWGVMRSHSYPCLAQSLTWRVPTPRRCRLQRGSSARGHSAGPTTHWFGRVANRSTGRLNKALILQLEH